MRIGDTNRFEVATSVAKLVFDTSNAPDLRQWTEEKFVPTMREWVVKLTGIMASDGWTPPKEILFQFVVEPLRPGSKAPAWASTGKNTVNLRVDWFRKNLNGEALGATVHELTHIMQTYSSKGRNKDNCPSWASEGYADYIRWILFEPEADGCGYVRKNIEKYHYNGSYRVTAHFFGFVEGRYPGTMKKLNAALRDNTFDNGKFWKETTGKPVEDLEADWKSDVAVAATTPKVEDFNVKLTGVAVLPTDDEGEVKAKVLPPETRIVVTPGNLAVFFLEYNFPTNVQSRMYLGPNFDEGVLGEDPFGTSASGLISGKGKITKVVLLGAGGDEPYEKDLLLKSVRISGELEAEEGAPRNNSFFICDAPVNVLFANKADSDGKGAVVLPPKPAPKSDPKLGVVPFDRTAKPKSSTPPGFTDNLDEALAKAKKEGKLVYVCFSGSDWCGWCKKLESEVFSQPEFVPAVEKDYVLVYIDSPGNMSVLTERAKKENPKLVKKYGIEGFPTALILDGDGNKVGETGFRKGGAQAYAEHLLDIKKKR